MFFCGTKRKPWYGTMSKEAIVEATNNYDKLMDRCWYGVAGTVFPANIECCENTGLTRRT